MPLFHADCRLCRHWISRGHVSAFLHDEADGLPLLLKAALAHVQFETIHPFLDGNGRLGRLLIALLLHQGGLLGQPLLYLSLKQLCLTSGMTFPTAGKAMQHLVALGVARELTGQRRNRVFDYDAYLAILNEGGEPL